MGEEIYTRVRSHTLIHKHTHNTNIHINTHTGTRTYIKTLVFLQIHIHIYTRIHIHNYMHIHIQHTHIQICRVNFIYPISVTINIINISMDVRMKILKRWEKQIKSTHAPTCAITYIKWNKIYDHPYLSN